MSLSGGDGVTRLFNFSHLLSFSPFAHRSKFLEAFKLIESGGSGTAAACMHCVVARSIELTLGKLSNLQLDGDSFGLSIDPRASNCRMGRHLFFMLEAAGLCRLDIEST